MSVSSPSPLISPNVTDVAFPVAVVTADTSTRIYGPAGTVSDLSSIPSLFVSQLASSCWSPVLTETSN